MTTVEKTHRFDYTDVLFWLGILLMTAWIIGKLLGLIQSPVWVDLLPFIAALVTILSIGLKAGRILQKLDYVVEGVDKLDKRVVSLEKRVTILETNARIGLS